jgi:anti-sigma B factor antagonist
MATITPARTGPVSVLTVSGEIDVASVPLLRAALDEALDHSGPGMTAPACVVVDLTAATFLGSAGLAVLVEAHEQATQRGIDLKVVIDGPGSPVARAFQAAAIHEHLDVHHALPDGGSRPVP